MHGWIYGQNLKISIKRTLIKGTVIRRIPFSCDKWKFFLKDFLKSGHRTGLRNNFYARCTHIFSLKLLLDIILSSFLHTVNNLFYIFLRLIQSIFRSKTIVQDQNFKSISGSSINTFSGDFTFDDTVRKSKKKV